jgi:hypothetical protein
MELKKDARDFIPREDLENELIRLKNWVAIAKERKKEKNLSEYELKNIFGEGYSAIDLNLAVQAALKRMLKSKETKMPIKACPVGQQEDNRQ